MEAIYCWKFTHGLGHGDHIQPENYMIFRKRKYLVSLQTLALRGYKYPVNYQVPQAISSNYRTIGINNFLCRSLSFPKSAD